MLDLEREAVELAAALLEHGTEEAVIEEVASSGVDPGADVARLAVERGGFSPQDLAARVWREPPVWRAFGRNRRVRVIEDGPPEGTAGTMLATVLGAYRARAPELDVQNERGAPAGGDAKHRPHDE